MHSPTPRHGEILRLVRERGTISVTALAAELRVSEETVRRDIRPLAASGDVIKLHGAVALPQDVGEAPFERRMRVNAEAKRAIARHAAHLIEDGDSLMLDTGTTTSFLARELLRKRNLTVVTNSSDIARTLATVNGNQVFMAGGELNGDNGAAFGASAIQFVSTFHVRHAFITIGAIDAEFGPTDTHLAEAEFGRMVLSRGDNRYILTDSSKFGRRALIKVCELSDVHCLISEKSPPPEIEVALKSAHVRCEVA
jgi:DeoR family glycerol-3-phosphate regulon repressor